MHEDNHRDTLYADPFNQAEDYELGLFETDGIEMGRSLLSINPREDGQSPCGLFALFGAEVLLSAAGVPSESEHCALLGRWGKDQHLVINPKLGATIKKSDTKIYLLRRGIDGKPDGLPPDAKIRFDRGSPAPAHRDRNRRFSRAK